MDAISPGMGNAFALTATGSLAPVGLIEWAKHIFVLDVSCPDPIGCGRPIKGGAEHGTHSRDCIRFHYLWRLKEQRSSGGRFSNFGGSPAESQALLK